MSRPAPRPAQCVECGAPAPEERVVEGLVVRLCEEHARELDADRETEGAEGGGVTH